MLDKAKAPAEVLPYQGRDSRGDANACTDESTSRKPKRKLGSVWLETGRYLYRAGFHGSTVFDTWKWMDEPLTRRGE